MQPTPNPRRPAEQAETKKPYHKPDLLVYGNIREITRNVGPKGAEDNLGGAAAGPKTGT
jgi:hypothetical protein